MMFHSSSGVHMPNRRGRPRCGFRSFMPTTSFNRQDSKEPLRRGILFSSVAFVLLLTGVMLTWLGLREPFSDKVSMTGPLLIAVALLVLLLSFRQFMVARERSRAVNGAVQQLDTISTGGVTTVIVDDEEGNTATVVVEAWDTEEPLREETRTTGDLAPPAYIDISQSCSSMCPSFVSHDDHNEAPPSYEETCGTVYLSSSEHSLSLPGSQRSSLQDSSHPDPAGFLAAQQAQSQADQDGAPDWRKLRESPRSSLLSPAHSGALMAQAAVRRQRQSLPPLTLNNRSDQQAMLPAVSSSTLTDQETSAGHVCIGSPSPENLSQCSQIQSPDSGHLAATAPPTPVPPGVQQCQDQTSWSRRSFSSIPSYTCLLGKSGEVSAQIFDTSSIIQGMMPQSTVQGGGSNDPKEDHRTRNTLSPTADTTGVSDLLPDQSAIPARSHSLSSVVPLRVGVPYKVCHTQEQPKSPLRSHGVSSPLLSSPQHSLDLSSQPQQPSQQQLSSHSDAKRSSTSLSVPGAHSLHQNDDGSSDHLKDKEDNKLYKRSSITPDTSIDESVEVCDVPQASGQSTAGLDEDTRLSAHSTGSGREETMATVSAERRSPVMSSLDIQETI